MLPIERLQQVLVAREAQVRVLGFTADRKSKLAQLLVENGHHAIFDDFAVSRASLDPPSGADIIIWDTQLHPTVAHGVDARSLSDGTARIAGDFRLGQLLVVTGPVPPGTIRGLILPQLAAGGLRPGHDFLLVYTPSLELDKACIFGGLDPISQAAGTSFLTSLMPAVVPVSTLETAELCGLIPQIYRTIQSAVGNELRMLGDRIGASIWEASAAMGLPELCPTAGDHDSASAFLTWGSRRFGTVPRICELASEIIAAMPAFVLAKLEEALNERGRPLRESRILLWGSRRQVPTHSPTRASLSDELLTALQKKGANVAIHTPGVATSMLPPATTAELFSSQNVVVILGDHPGCDYEFLVTHSQLVLDTQNATRHVAHGREKVIVV